MFYTFAKFYGPHNNILKIIKNIYKQRNGVLTVCQVIFCFSVLLM